MSNNELLAEVLAKGAAIFRGSKRALKTLHDRLFHPVEVADDLSVNTLAKLIEAQGVSIAHLRELIVQMREVGASDDEIKDLANRQANLMKTMSEALETITRHVAKGTVVRAQLVKGVIQLPAEPRDKRAVLHLDETKRDE